MHDGLKVQGRFQTQRDTLRATLVENVSRLQDLRRLIFRHLLRRFPARAKETRPELLSRCHRDEIQMQNAARTPSALCIYCRPSGGTPRNFATNCHAEITGCDAIVHHLPATGV